MLNLKKRPLPFIILTVFTLLTYLPSILSPNKLLERGNDLQEQFWPVFYFIRTSFWETGTLPLWNNLFFAGTPLLPDPQFSLYYPPNWLFILLPTDQAFVIWLMLHSAVGGLGLYLTLAKFFNISTIVAITGSLLYIASPAIGNLLEAGHYGLVGTYTWLPFLILSVVNIAKQPKYLWLVLGSISLSGLFYTHTVIFLISTVLSATLLVTTLIFREQKIFVKSFIFYILMLIMAFGLSAVTFLPQLDWSKDTTRFLLLENRETYPQWNGFQDFLSGIVPWIQGINKLQNLETEKWIVLGPLAFIFTTIGLWGLKKNIRVMAGVVTVLVLLIVLNNLSPLYKTLLSLDLFVLSRVSTRIWFIISIAAVILTSFSLERILKKDKRTFYLFAILLVLESIGIFWARTQKSIAPEDRFAPKEVYEYLSQDHEGLFRVFCTTRCLSQKQAVIYRLQLVEGYNTLSQTNYFKHMWQITNSYWGYYTLAVPPPGIYKFKQIFPDTQSLGEYNTKYIVSPYQINNQNLQLQKSVQNYHIYKNMQFKPRIYNSNPRGPSPDILVYSPNLIQINARENTKSVILAEVYSRGWRAYLEGGKEILVQETPNALRLIDTESKKVKLTLVYNPKPFLLGKIITVASVILILCLLFWKKLKTLFSNV